MNIKQFIFDNSPINKCGQRCPIILEAGTAHGFDTVEFAKTYPHGVIYGIEPITAMYDHTYMLTKSFNNVKLFKKALSDKNGSTEMYVSYYYGSPTGSSSILEPKDHVHLHPEITFNNKEIVETITLDDFVEEQNISHIDFMWLDLQGYEPIVLNKSIKTLKKSRYLHCEVTMIEYYKDNIKYPEFKKFLNDNNFEVLDESEIFTPNGIKEAGNVLFKNTLYY